MAPKMSPNMGCSKRVRNCRSKDQNSAFDFKLAGAIIAVSLMILSSLYGVGVISHTEATGSPISPNVANSSPSPDMASSVFFDNFTNDTNLNTQMWEVNGPAQTIAETNFSSPSNTVVQPSLSFSPDSGMEMSGVTGSYEATGIQSNRTFSGAFVARASVYASEAHANPFIFGITSMNGSQGIAIVGNMNSSNGGYYGIWVSSPVGSSTGFWSWQPNPLLTSPALNQIYILTIQVYSNGTATVTAGLPGALGSSYSMQIGNASYYLFLAQYEGLPYYTGPNHAFWQFAGVKAISKPPSNSTSGSATEMYIVAGVLIAVIVGIAITRRRRT